MGKYDALMNYSMPETTTVKSATGKDYSALMNYSLPETAPIPQSSTMPEREEKGQTYLGRIGEVIKDIPETVGQAWERTQKRAERTFAPTELGKLAPEGIARETLAAPERVSRAVLGTAGTIGEIAGVPAEIATKGINAILGGKPGDLIQKAIKKGAESEIGKKVIGAASKWWEGLDESARANYGSLPDVLDLIGMGGGKTALKGSTSEIGGVLEKSIKPIVKKTIEAPNKFAQHFAQELSGVSKEALEMAGTKAGREALEKAAGTQKKIGEKILASLDDYEKFLPDREQITKALDNMPEIGTKKTIRILKDHIDPKAVGGGKTANVKLEKIISDIQEKYGNKVNAKTFFSLRKKIDNEIGDAWGKESSSYIEALKDVRYQMKEMLITSAEKSGNSEYAEAMKSLAYKMDVVDRLKGFVGKSQKVRDKRIESFVANLFGANKTEAQTLIKDLGEIFGEDFLNQSKIARLAGELGEGGKASFLPRQTTGRSLMAIGPQIALGSPYLASKITLPALKGAEKGTMALLRSAEKTGKFPGKGSKIKGTLRGLYDDESNNP